MATSSESIQPPWSPLISDVNGDGQFTISDVGLWLTEAFFLPGDWLIWLLTAHAPGVGQFLEIGAVDYGGTMSGIVSGCVWFVLLIFTLIAYNFVRVVDHAVTSRIRQIHDDGLRRLRMAPALLKYRWRRIGPKPEPTTMEFTEELELSEQELRALVAHVELKPPYALGLSEVASAVGVRKRQAQQIVDRLRQLDLLDRATGAADGESAYMLTQTGRAFLVFRQLAPRD